MVPVRKPGRPLSLCPHPPSRQCGCAGGVTAAIPRKQQCRCGASKPPASKGGSASPKIKSSPPGETPPKSPAKTTSGSGSFRVQKPPKPQSRKASIDPSTLNRIDLSQVNIMPSLDTRSPSQTPNRTPVMQTIPNLSNGHYGQIHHPGQGAMNHIMYPIFPHQMPPPGSNHNMAPIHAEVHSGTISSESFLAGQTPHTPISEGRNNHLATLHRRAGSGTNNDVMPKKGSCCGSASSTPQPASMQPVEAAHVPQPSPGMVMPGVGPQGQPFAHFYPHPTVFTYPPHYGSYLQPLLPELWKQAMDSMMAQGLGSPNPMGPPNIGYMTSPAPSTPTIGTSHVCTCGDGCQCIGCAAHPYNDATQNYVRSAWNLMMEDSWANGMSSPIATQAPQAPQPLPQVGELPHTNGRHPSPLGNTKTESSCCGNGHANGSSSASPVLAAHHVEGLNGNGNTSVAGPTSSTSTAATGPGTVTSPKASPTPQTPSDTASGTSDEILSANDFFFVTYPLTDTCVGDTASCPCGDDCQCLGCVVHGNNPMPDSSAPSGT